MASPARLTVRSVREQRLLVGKVPTRVFEPEGARALLLLGHGGGHGKDGSRFVRLGRHYAAQTVCSVVCIDAVDHGERRLVAAADGVPRGWHSRAMPRVVADWQAVVAHLSSVGPPLAYVGFSMGALFGLATVAAMASITAAVLVAGGLPGGGWTDDAELVPLLTTAATKLGHAHVLMLNKEDDELFPESGARALFEHVVARSKRLAFSPGGHDEWGPEMIDASVRFVREHARTRAPGEQW